jgi:hypothetical protein
LRFAKPVGRKFFVLADIGANAKRGNKAAPISPMALEAVKRIDALFEIEREINGLAADQRMERRRQDSLTIVEELHDWLQTERTKLSRSSPVAEPIDYMLKRWDGFTSFLDDGRICLTNNAAERVLRGFALGRKSWLFAGSDRDAERAASRPVNLHTIRAPTRSSTDAYDVSSFRGGHPNDHCCQAGPAYSTEARKRIIEGVEIRRRLDDKMRLPAVSRAASVVLANCHQTGIPSSGGRVD